jgi:hypothetical protein
MFPRRLVMEEGSRIGHLSLCKDIDLLHLGDHAIIGQLNWITGFPSGPSKHFAHQPDRRPELVVERHASITSRHFIDCTASIRIGAFATVGGFRSQLLHHRFRRRRQTAEPIDIGDYSYRHKLCGARRPCAAASARSWAPSASQQKMDEPYRLYAGVPARS